MTEVLPNQNISKGGPVSVSLLFYMNTINAKEIKEQVCLVDLLARLGYHPVKPAGRELLYISMLRDSDTHPSFSVYQKLGVWYDHGLAKGGNIIDFGMAYWKLSFQETLDKIVSVTGLPVIIKTEPKRQHAHKIPHYQVQDIKELGNNSAITAYLKERGIWQAAQGKLKEIYYYVEDEKKLRKHFFAAGSQNETGGWEVRNKYFKGCLGHKALTIIEGRKKQLAVFEGYFDYLSWLTEQQKDHTVIITNSVALLPQAIGKSKDFTSVHLYFDNDETGREATMQFKLRVPQAIDESSTYQPHKDYNEKITAGLNIRTPGIFQHAFART
jgi:DNA primase